MYKLFLTARAYLCFVLHFPAQRDYAFLHAKRSLAKAKSGFAGDAGYFLLRALTCASSCAFPRKEITLSSMPNGVWR
ncbi:MAG: hypothetical protein ACLT3G_12030, partial [Acutalibacteraceae bacterium]